MGPPRHGGRVGRDPDVERLARAHRLIEGAHGLLERRAGVDPVRVEDVDMVEPHAPEAFVKAGQQVLPGTADPVGSRPHVPARLGRDHQLAPERAEIIAQDATEILLGRAVRRSVVVREIEVRDAAVERAADHGAAGLEHVRAAEIVPEAERDGRQVEAAPAAAAEGGVPVAGRVWLIRHHGFLLPPRRTAADVRADRRDRHRTAGRR